MQRHRQLDGQNINGTIWYDTIQWR